MTSIYQHIRSRGLYEFIAEGFQERDMTPIVVYRSCDNGKVFTRPREEFFDGRFEFVGTKVNAPFDPVRDIAEFHEKFGIEYRGSPRALPKELARFRNGFKEEELAEYMAAQAMAYDETTRPRSARDRANYTHHLEQALDGLVDLVYVALGSAYLHGFNFKEAWRRVHEANMKKVRASSAADSKRGSAFDVVKPAGWEPPSHTDLVEVNDILEPHEDRA